MIRQQKLKEFFPSENSSSSSVPSDDELNSNNQDQQEKKKRGRPREPLRWTRVFKIKRDILQEIETFNVENDDKEFFDEYDSQPPSQDLMWKPLFNPQDFKDIQNELRSEEYKLNENQLLDFAKQVTLIRETLLQEAENIKILECEDLLKDKDLSTKEPHNYRRPHSGPRQKINQPASESTSLFKYQANRPKKRTLKNLSTEDKTNVVYDALVGLQSNEQVASKYNIKDSQVSRIVSKMKNNGDYLREKARKEENEKNVEDLVSQVTQDLLKSGQHIWRVSMIQFILLEKHEIDVSLDKIKRIFKEKLDLRFKRIKRIPFLGNCERCLVMRQLYATKMISIMQTSKTIWNFDESFLKDSFFVRRKWCHKDEQNSIPKQGVSPRISVFLALNNHGEGYLSLSQSKTDSARVILFFKYFFEQLDLSDTCWRENSVLLMDNAPYHVSDETIEYLRRSGVAVFFSAPYSYDAAAAEMWFSYFKSKDINPDGLSSGKMSFQNVAKFVAERLNHMNKSANVKFWRYSTLSLFKYLTFEKL